MTRASRILAFLAAAALTACASGGNVALPAARGTADAGRVHRANDKLVVRVRVPKKKHALSRLDPRYVSVATKGITMAFSGPSNFTEVFGLTTHDPRCTGSPLSCTLVLFLAAGNYAVTIDTYDQAPVSGTIPANAKLLSTARSMPLTIRSAISNQANFTLDGVPANIIVGGFPNASAGTALSNQSFGVTVKDADGYTIVGTYTTPVTLVDDDTSGVTSIATSGNGNPPTNELLGSSDRATISYTGRTIRPVTIAASAGPVTGSGLFVVTLPVYVADYSNNEVKEIAPGCVMAGCVTTLGGSSTFSLPQGVAVDVSGNVYVADTFNNVVQKMTPGCATATCVSTIGGGFSGPGGVAVDGSGNVFVADYANHAVKEIPAGCATSLCVASIGGGINSPTGVAVDGSGNVFVSDYGSTSVKKIPPSCTTSTCVTNLGGGFSHPIGVAVDGSGNVFVADLNNDTVTEIPPGCTSTSCETLIGGTFSSPSGAAVDGAGNVLTTDTHGVEKIPPGCVISACVTLIGGGFANPYGVAVF
jgi:sugar lactone lactonase YvrE